MYVCMYLQSRAIHTRRGDYPTVRHRLYPLVQRAELDIKALQLIEELALLRPDGELLGQLWDDQVGPPADDLLRLEDVAVDVVTEVQHVPALGVDEAGEHLT